MSDAPLSHVETFCLPLPTFGGIIALLYNALAISDRLAADHRLIFIFCAISLWCFPIVFTWPVWPFKTTLVYVLYLLGFEKGGVRRGSPATRYQSHYYGGIIPYDSTFSYLQSTAAMGETEDEEASTSVPIYARALGWIAGALAVRALLY